MSVPAVPHPTKWAAWFMSLNSMCTCWGVYSTARLWGNGLADWPQIFSHRSNLHILLLQLLTCIQCRYILSKIESDKDGWKFELAMPWWHVLAYLERFIPTSWQWDKNLFLKWKLKHIYYCNWDESTQKWGGFVMLCSIFNLVNWEKLENVSVVNDV